MLAPGELLKIEEDIPMEKIRQVRREAKKKVFVTNAVRALKKVAPEHNLKKVPNVVLVGGSAEDFEIPEMLTEALAEYRIVCGREISGGRKVPEMLWQQDFCFLVWDRRIGRKIDGRK